MLKAIKDSENSKNTREIAIDYEVIAELRKQELEIFKGIEKESKSKVGNLTVIINRIQNKTQILLSQSEKFNRNKGLLAIQAKLALTPIPIVSGGTALVSATLGPQFAPLAYGLLLFVKWSPAIAILIKEGGVVAANQVRGRLMPMQPSKPAYA